MVFELAREKIVSSFQKACGKFAGFAVENPTKIQASVNMLHATYCLDDKFLYRTPKEPHEPKKVHIQSSVLLSLVKTLAIFFVNETKHVS